MPDQLHATQSYLSLTSISFILKLVTKQRSSFTIEELFLTSGESPPDLVHSRSGYQLKILKQIDHLHVDDWNELCSLNQPLFPYLEMFSFFEEGLFVLTRSAASCARRWICAPIAICCSWSAFCFSVCNCITKLQRIGKRQHYENMFVENGFLLLCSVRQITFRLVLCDPFTPTAKIRCASLRIGSRRPVTDVKILTRSD